MRDLLSTIGAGLMTIVSVAAMVSGLFLLGSLLYSIVSWPLLAVLKSVGLIQGYGFWSVVGLGFFFFLIHKRMTIKKGY